jgi:RimJ/RimL family protein N-acetyltransferase
MQPKLLTIKDYFEYFSFQEDGTGCGFEFERHSSETYFWIQTFLPQYFFNIDNSSLFFNPTIVPDYIQVKFELFGIGYYNGITTYIFKPWVVNIDNPIVYQLFENFHLYIPSTLFYNIVDRAIFLEHIDSNLFSEIRVLQDLPSDSFKRIGLDRPNVPNVICNENFEISRIIEVDEFEISKFYKNNWVEIKSNIHHKYFRPLLNTWFKITINEKTYQMFGFKHSTTRKTIGYLRLYCSNSSFLDGISLEYVIDKSYRNKGYASRASLELINHLKSYSYAISLGAEVDDNNVYSKKVLKRLGFTEKKVGHFDRNNYELSLLGNLEVFESNLNDHKIKVSVINKYANRYYRYFNINGF